jgi:3-oxoacyl-[acyl-carrier protein] reductase
MNRTNSSDGAHAAPAVHPSASLHGLVALVTGASGSIGAEVSRTLAARGAAVAVHGRAESALENLVSDIRERGGVAVAHVGDVRDPSQLEAAVADIASTLGTIDVLVPLAGGDGMPAPTAALEPDRWRSVIELDLTSVFLTIHAALPGMLRLGRGRIVTVASSAGRRPSQANAAYAAAKAGVVMLTEHLAKEYATAGIRVNCLAPSIVETSTLRGRMSTPQLDAIAARVPLRRIGRPADVAEAVAFLASDASSWITGTTLDITGGMTL